MNASDDTITAVATAPGIGGIGIVRISGPKAIAIASALFRTPGNRPTPNHPYRSEDAPSLAHRRAHYGYIVDPIGGILIDEVILLCMQAPHSYTREDVVEIQSHAGTAVLQNILSLVIDGGARLADPGEFTRRAFLNGRIDLSQAEAVADLIAAKTDQAMALATQHLTGGLKQSIERIRTELETAAGHLEAMIEFPEDLDDEALDREQFTTNAENARHKIQRLLKAHQENHLYRDGIQVSVVGRPNVGKSSLMNALLQRERAIVTELPGTTRDVVTDTFQANGVPIQIADTAGLRTSDDLIERIGIQKTEESIAAAQLILFVLDGSDAQHPDDAEIYAKIRSKKMLVVMNKSDLTTTIAPLPTWLPDQTPSVSVSAKFEHNIETLKNRIVTVTVGDSKFQPSGSIVPTLRQKTALEQTLSEVQSAIDACGHQYSEEIIVFHLQSALNSLGKITGETYSDDLLDVVFERFCIGK